MPVASKLLDILPALRDVGLPGGIVPRQPVHQTDRRPPPQDRLHIHRGNTIDGTAAESPPKLLQAMHFRFTATPSLESHRPQSRPARGSCAGGPHPASEKTYRRPNCSPEKLSVARVRIGLRFFVSPEKLLGIGSSRFCGRHGELPLSPQGAFDAGAARQNRYPTHGSVMMYRGLAGCGSSFFLS